MLFGFYSSGSTRTHGVVLKRMTEHQVAAVGEFLSGVGEFLQRQLPAEVASGRVDPSKWSPIHQAKKWFDEQRPDLPDDIVLALDTMFSVLEGELNAFIGVIRKIASETLLRGKTQLDEANPEDRSSVDEVNRSLRSVQMVYGEHKARLESLLTSHGRQKRLDEWGLALEERVRVLEARQEGLSQQLTLALQYLADDPHGSLNKSRTVCEKLVVDVFRTEMNKEPKKPMLGEMLHDNQFTRKLDRRILYRMTALANFGNLGTHGEDVTESDARNGIENLFEIVDWYVENYRVSRSS